MDFPEIGAWAGDKGPYVAIIGLQFSIIWKLLNRFFAQQDVVMRTLNLADRAVQVAEKPSQEN